MVKQLLPSGFLVLWMLTRFQKSRLRPPSAPEEPALFCPQARHGRLGRVFVDNSQLIFARKDGWIAIIGART